MENTTRSTRNINPRVIRGSRESGRRKLSGKEMAALTHAIIVWMLSWMKEMFKYS